jgi:FlaA1/EpsC-like NDP-sugar epimerase
VPRGQWFTSRRKSIKIGLDAVAILMGFLVALAMRFEFKIPSRYFTNLLIALLFIVPLFLLANSLTHLYSGHWKHASFDELINLSSASTISTVVLSAAVMVIPGARKLVPVSVAVIGGLFSLFALSFVRLRYRFFSERRLRRSEPTGRKVLLIGAGEAGEMVARDMLRHPEYDYSPVGFIDDDTAKKNLVIQGVHVLGGREDIPSIAERLGVDEIFITIPSVSGEKIREILPFCEKTGAKIQILPGIFLTMAGDVGVESIRELRLEDLLGREQVKTDIESIAAYITGKVVMVTGAGGSIGSELSHQICNLRPRRLLLLDNDETSLFELEMDLAHRASTCSREVVLADIRDADRLTAVFERYRPQVIFHSAAMKHVPMMESHPSEAVKNNVLGTRNLAQLGTRYEVERFILISTDKAVQPVNVMGTTKRVAELLLRGSEGNGTLFTAVRFGNVLGSRGSVVPIFKKQIEEGGPVLVTHNEVTRYFMTMEEAAQLVIQAGAFSRGDDLFILDMGEPVRIVDLACDMVRLLGGGRDIEIRVTGLRPGEKLHEKLVFQVEEMLPTPHPKINKVVHDTELPQDFDAQVDELIEAAVRDNEDEIRARLSRLVPSYQAGSAEEEMSEAAEDALQKKAALRLVN